MISKGYSVERLVLRLSLFLALFSIISPAMSIRVMAGDKAEDTGKGDTYTVTPSGIVSSSNPMEEVIIENLSYDAESQTLIFNGAEVRGTLVFLGVQSQESDQMETAYYTIYLTPGTINHAFALQLHYGSVVTIKGSGELDIRAETKNSDYGAALTFNDQYGSDPSRLIIEEGTVSVDGTNHGYAFKEAGCLYIKDGVEEFKLIGRTTAEGKEAPVIPSKDSLTNGERIPSVFSDIPCRARYCNSTEEITLEPNGADDEKTIDDESLLDSEGEKLYKIIFRSDYIPARNRITRSNSVSMDKVTIGSHEVSYPSLIPYSFEKGKSKDFYDIYHMTVSSNQTPGEEYAVTKGKVVTVKIKDGDGTYTLDHYFQIKGLTLMENGEPKKSLSSEDKKKAKVLAKELGKATKVDRKAAKTGIGKSESGLHVEVYPYTLTEANASDSENGLKKMVFSGKSDKYDFSFIYDKTDKKRKVKNKKKDAQKDPAIVTYDTTTGLISVSSCEIQGSIDINSSSITNKTKDIKS
ncbi:MAG: hypothetical protein K5989_11705 [Lachnospiraceae bacterium]|nr:hypothetical protein [Lachnospiraceae bacterium]